LFFVDTKFCNDQKTGVTKTTVVVVEMEGTPSIRAGPICRDRWLWKRTAGETLANVFCYIPTKGAKNQYEQINQGIDYRRRSEKTWIWVSGGSLNAVEAKSVSI